MADIDISLGLSDTHVLVTGGNGLIGTTVVHAFLSAGAHVTSLDISYTSPFTPASTVSPNFQKVHADISSEQSLEAAWLLAEGGFGPVSCCIALASLDYSVLEHHDSLADMSLEQLKRTLDVNIGGTFLTARCWLRGLREAKLQGKELRNVNIVIVGSESGRWGERTNADYACSKSAVQVGLVQSLRQDVGRVYEGARANAVAPGPVDTSRFKKECEENPDQYWLDCQGTTALGKPVPIEAVAKSILFLASDSFSAHVHGQVLNVDSGKLGKIVHMKE